MHVTRVELENIKCYEHADFNFARGTTAIVGKNGAGKTTILEAIAWTLFDSMEYSKTDFVRRGAKKGIVRVTFQSDVDEREYTVYRDTGNGYYIYDPALKGRIAEQKKDVSDLLHLHLGIEPGTDLKALFRSAIGVPQGLFTAAFLETSVKRKAEFDRLLKVEEYRASADKLLETVNLINARIEEARRRIASAEGQLIGYDALVADRAHAETTVRELTATLAAAEVEAEACMERVAKFDAAERTLNEARTRLDRLEVERANAERRVTEADAELAEANHAAKRARDTKDASERHTTALVRLRELDTERLARDRARAAHDAATRLVMTAENEARRAAEALEIAECAREALTLLQPEVERQRDIERERERLRDLRARAVAARESLTRLEHQLKNLRDQHRQTSERVRAAEPLRDAASRLHDLEIERADAETKLAHATEAANNRKHLTENRRQVVKEIERLTNITNTLGRDIVRLESLSARAATLIETEARFTQTATEVANLRAEVARDERMQREVRGGLCPILSERCLNIPAGHNLSTYFTDQLATHRALLTARESEHQDLQNEIRLAREAAAHHTQLAAIRAQLARERELLTTREIQLQDFETKLAALDAGNESTLQAMRNHLNGINGSLIKAREDALRYAELGALRERLSEITEEGTRRKSDHAELAAAAAGIEQLESDLRDTDAQLDALNDPRGRSITLKQETAREPARRRIVEETRTAYAAARDALALTDTHLQTFSYLDDAWQQATQTRDATVEDYRAHLSAAALAATLPARQTKSAHANEEAARLLQDEQTARTAHDTAHKDYDREAHTSARTALQLARERLASLATQLSHTQERLAALITEIEMLDEVRSRVREELAEVERLRRLYETTDFVRDTLKKAAPLVTESYLAGISIEANALFREITGDSNRSLRWTRDYEVILEEDGHERSFQNLSGGEQMVAALSIRLALLKQLSDIRLAFFDEPTINMDAERRARLAESLGRVRDFNQLFVISHDDAFEETADHVLNVELRNTVELRNADFGVRIEEGQGALI